MMIRTIKCLFVLSVLTLLCISCGKPSLSRDLKGVGPVAHIELAPLNDSLMNIGKTLFENRCASCHTMEYKNVGPDISDILAYRHVEWVMNFMLNKDEMLRRDSLSLITRGKYDRDCGSDIRNYEDAIRVVDYLRQYQIWLHEFNVR